jgi:ribosomal RNA assembly protein
MGKRKRKDGEAEDEGPKNENGDVNSKERGAEDGVQYNAQGKKKGKHDKDKPWDTPDIDHWKLEPWDPSFNEGGLLEKSSFATLFPKYRGFYSARLLLIEH